MDQIARFTDDVNLTEFARMSLSVGGLEPGDGHDQVIFDSDIEFNGELIVDLLPEFAQHPNDRYTLATYASHSGQFALETLPALDGGLAFYLDYGENQLDLVVGFTGGTPGAPNCGGQVTQTQANEHGGIAAGSSLQRLRLRKGVQGRDCRVLRLKYGNQGGLSGKSGLQARSSFVQCASRGIAPETKRSP